MDTNPKPKRLTRVQAAAHLADRLGVPFSPRTVEKLPVPYALLNGRSSYLATDLDAYADSMTASATRRTGGLGRSGRMVVSTGTEQHAA